MVTYFELTKHGKDMDKERITKKIEAMAAGLRKSAAEVQQGLDVAQNLRKGDIERQKELIDEAEATLRYLKAILAKMEAEKWVESQKRLKAAAEALLQERKIVTASTAEEADWDAPTAELRAFQFNGKTKEEVLASGTIQEKMRLYVCYKDAANYFDNKSGELTDEERVQIGKELITDEGKEKAARYMYEYRALLFIGEQVRYYFKMFQVAYSFLAQLLNRLDRLEQMAGWYTKEVRAIAAIPTAKELKEGEQRPHFNTEADRKMAIEKSVTDHRKLWDEPAFLGYHPSTMDFFIAFDKRSRIYTQILQAAREATEALSDFKGFAVAAEEYVANSELKYMPISIETPIVNAKEERYIRYLVSNPKFFRSELHRTANPTPEDKRRAVIPDYYEVKPTREMYEDAKDALESYEE